MSAIPFAPSNGKEIVAPFTQKDDANLRSRSLQLMETLILDDKQQVYGYASLYNQSNVHLIADMLFGLYFCDPFKANSRALSTF
jgi:hypothetical protein